jgi:alkylation response protein AidB-like acyl-CoA dehydrogenase
MASLEEHLGDPEDDSNVVSFAKAAARDEDEAYPEDALEKLHAWPIVEAHIPASLGGTLCSYEELLALGRTIARRDMTLAVSAAMLLWSTLAWLAGTASQKAHVAAFLRAKKVFCLGYSEREHGSDLLANETVATKEGGRWVITGEKWPIGRATRADAAIVLARTGPPGPLGMTLFLVEKGAPERGGIETLPKVPTLGVQGCDISGLRFDRCAVDDAARLGAEGAGLDLALKGLQVSRTLCSALSLGAADAALRTTMNLAMSRRLYGARVWDMAIVRETLTLAFLDLLGCECVARAAARALHVLPGQASVWAAVAKYQVPTAVDGVLRELATVQGARFYMRSAHDHGVFQRMYRDHLIVPIFDGNTMVNLQALASQLRSISRRRSERDAHRADRLGRLLSLGVGIPDAPIESALEGLELMCRGHDDLLSVDGLATVRARVDDSSGHAHARMRAAADAVATRRDALFEELDVAAQRHGRAFSAAPEAYAIAREYARLHAAAAILGCWAFGGLPTFLADGAIVVALERLLSPTRLLDPQGRAWVAAAADELARLHAAKAPFQISPVAPLVDEPRRA